MRTIAAKAKVLDGMNDGPSFLKQIIAVAVLFAVAMVLFAGHGLTQPVERSTADSLAAWDKIAEVLRHPRCLNCHQLNEPLQGNVPRPHVPPVVRGPDNLGTGTMHCRNCHNESGNNAMSGVPGAPHWQLAPASMLWQGLTVGELCRALKDPRLNGDRTPDALVEHMSSDKLVLWGWQPGGRRAPVPVSHKEFVDLLKIWVSGGAACPQ